VSCVERVAGMRGGGNNQLGSVSFGTPWPSGHAVSIFWHVWATAPRGRCLGWARDASGKRPDRASKLVAAGQTTGRDSAAFSKLCSSDRRSGMAPDKTTARLSSVSRIFGWAWRLRTDASKCSACTAAFEQSARRPIDGAARDCRENRPRQRRALETRTTEPDLI
jgi:hypothetical protein